jgi:hypothetical protein
LIDPFIFFIFSNLALQKFNLFIMRILIIVFLCIKFFVVHAGEGMWLPHLLKQLNEAEMKDLGMKMSALDIYNVNKGSLKDAIVHFGGFCTGEVISDKGLVLTNHHCGYGRIQSHSSMEKNLLEHGFWASNLKQELPNPGLFVTFIIRIEEVTKEVLSGIPPDATEIERMQMVNRNLETVKKNAKLGKNEDAMVKPFFHGNQFFMFFTKTYRDIRLVGAPPSSVGKFGADTDNWEWPRHTGDFALFRIYADKNNEPAEFSEDNVPFKPKHFLPISLDGVEEGDFTLVFGFPGKTDQYLPGIALEQTIHSLNPIKIEIREKVLSILDQGMRSNLQTKIQYASKYASIANAYKKWIGERQGLLEVNALEKKNAREKDFMSRLKTMPALNTKYGHILPELDELYRDVAPYYYARDLFSEVTGRNIDIMRFASMAATLIRVGENSGPDALQSRWSQIKISLINQYANYDPQLDQKVYAALLEILHQKADTEFLAPYFKELAASFQYDFQLMASEIYARSHITSLEKWAFLMESEDVPTLIRALSEDPAVALYNALISTYNETVSVKLAALTPAIDELQRQYMKAQMEVFKEHRFWPDANSTMRVTYGQVEGYKPRDAVQYKPVTYLSGVIEKYIPGDYEFDLPKRLIELKKVQDFGPYSDESGDVPVCFLGSNHTTGGNSGSPALDAYGNLIGLNFDRVWEGTMSDLNYDRSICRNIMVDARYILFIIDKYAGANNILAELKLVHPKTGKNPPVFKVMPQAEGTLQKIKPSDNPTY